MHCDYVCAQGNSPPGAATRWQSDQTGTRFHLDYNILPNFGNTWIFGNRFLAGEIG